MTIFWFSLYFTFIGKLMLSYAFMWLFSILILTGTTFGISVKLGLVLNSLMFCLSEKVFLFHFSRLIFAGVGWREGEKMHTIVTD